MSFSERCFWAAVALNFCFLLMVSSEPTEIDSVLLPSSCFDSFSLSDVHNTHSEPNWLACGFFQTADSGLWLRFKGLAWFSRFKYLYALQLRLLRLPESSYTSRAGCGGHTVYEQWLTSSRWKKQRCQESRAERRCVPAPLGGLWASLHVSDAGKQFMVWMSWSGSLMRKYEVDNCTNRISRRRKGQPQATLLWIKGLSCTFHSLKT